MVVVAVFVVVVAVVVVIVRWSLLVPFVIARGCCWLVALLWCRLIYLLCHIFGVIFRYVLLVF